MITRVENDHVSRNKFASINYFFTPIAPNAGCCSSLTPQSLKRATGLPLSSKADQSIDGQHDKNSNGFENVCGDPGYRRSNCEKSNHNAGKLIDEDAPRWP